MALAEMIAECISSVLFTLLLASMVVFLVSIISSFTSSDMKVVRSSAVPGRKTGDSGNDDGDGDDDDDDDWQEEVEEEEAEDANAGLLEEFEASAVLVEHERESSLTATGTGASTPTVETTATASGPGPADKVSSTAEKGLVFPTPSSPAPDTSDDREVKDGILEEANEAGQSRRTNEEGSGIEGQAGGEDEAPAKLQENDEKVLDKDDEEDDEDWEGLEAASELEEAFNAAAALVVALVSPAQVSQEEEASSSPASSSSQTRGLGEGMQLLLYSLYKQATEGPCSGPRPPFFNFKARAKWDAWKQLGEMSVEEAMTKYVELVQSIHPGLSNESSEGGNGKDGETTQAQGSTAGGGGGGGGGRSVSTMLHEEDDEEEGTLEESQGLIQTLVMGGEIARLTATLESASANTIDAADGEGRTALHWAADRGLLDAVKILLEHGASIDVQDKEGQTPLHYAAICEHEAVARLLLQQGASTSIADVDSQSPADLLPSEWQKGE